MKTLADDVPTLPELVKEEMARIKRNTEIGKRFLRSQNRFFLPNDEEIDRINAILDEEKEEQAFWEVKENFVEYIWRLTGNIPEFQKKLFELCTKPGEQGEFFFVYQDKWDEYE